MAVFLRDVFLCGVASVLSMLLTVVMMMMMMDLPLHPRTVTR